eukprot:TRINITY_DN4128_c0_g2_i1.p1 TRINITY_DN4128_c0_g2~~TRINITY_DN4128_c0_g2_i1.p1  ORF type:complete len:366 (+),score=47.57 TRINITY_DN4128_c0_g2_i1:73-1170(+)
MEVFVRNTLTDEVNTIELYPDETIVTVRSNVADLFGLVDERFKLELNGDLLTNSILKGMSGGEELQVSLSDTFRAANALELAKYGLDEVDRCISNCDHDNFIHFITLSKYTPKDVVSKTCRHGFFKGLETLFSSTKLLTCLTEEEQFDTMCAAAGSSGSEAHKAVALLLQKQFPTMFRSKTVLMSAAVSGTLTTMELLIDSKLPGGNPKAHTYDGSCALSGAIYSGSKEKIDFMAQLNPHRCPSSLLSACDEGCTYSVKLCVDMGATVNHKQWGSAPLIGACSSGDLSCIRYLLYLDADMEGRDATGVSSIMMATRKHRRNAGITDLLYDTRKMRRQNRFDSHKPTLFREVNFSFSREEKSDAPW